jgi:hypothetical protein
MVVLTHRGLPAADIGTHRAGWEHRLGLLRVAAGLASIHRLISCERFSSMMALRACFACR